MNIGYNKSNQDYLSLLEEQNRLRKGSQNTREQAEKKRKEDKERGFNIHINGANEERIKEQRKAEVLASTSQTRDSHSQQRVRRMWKNPQGSAERQKNEGTVVANTVSSSQKQETTSGGGSGSGHHPKYHNPFDLRASKDGVSPIKVTGGAQRKRWGDLSSQPQQQVVPPVISSYPQGQNSNSVPPQKSSAKVKGEDDYYSDSFEEVKDYEEEKKSSDNEPAQQEDTIKQFLMTATQKDIDNLKNSLSTFGFAKPQHRVSKAPNNDDDDYIEEEFDEVIESDHGSSAESDSSEKERLAQLELQRKQQAVLVSKNIQTARNARNRPISATFNLEAQKITKQGGASIKSGVNPFEGSGYQNIQSNFGASQVSQQLQPSQSALSLQKAAKQPQPVSVQQAFSVHETPKQPNDFMKKPINTNPFKRPFSQNVPQRTVNRSKIDVDKDKMIEEDFVREVVQEEEEEEKGVTTTDKKPHILNIEDSLQSKGSQSQKVPIGAILTKIEQLDDWQKEKLMELLDNFDINAMNIPSSTKKANNEKLDFKFLSPPESNSQVGYTRPAAAIRNLGFGIPPGKKELIIKVLSTYGNPHICGLTEIELFDTSAHKIQLVPAALSLRNLGQGPKISLIKLLDGHKLTNEERHMWIGYRPAPPKNLEIVILLDKSQQLGGLKIWNYNKSAIDCTKGIKDIQILISQSNTEGGKDEQNVIWSGALDRGRGQLNHEYATFIKLVPNIELPREIKPTLTPVQSTIKRTDSEIQSDKSTQDSSKVSNNNEEMLKKYKSEAQLAPSVAKKEEGTTPIWLPTERKITNVASTAQLKKDVESGSKPFMSRRNQQEDQAKSQLSTYELLNKPAFQKNLDTDLKPSDNIKPPGDQMQPTNMMLQRDVSQKQFQSNNSRLQLQETSDAIKQAVNKVNQLTGNTPAASNSRIPSNKPVVATHSIIQKVQEEKKEMLMVNIEESLENLELFRATNLGRLLQSNGINKNVEDNIPKKQGMQQRLGYSPGQKSTDSGFSSTKHKGGAHVLVKNPFPDKQPMNYLGGKSTISTTSVNKKAVNFDDQDNDDDILDQFLNEIGNPKSTNQQSKAQVLEQQLPKKPLNDSVANNPLPKSFEERMKHFNEDFIMPSMPSGQRLHFNIHSTWGDVNYVGLTGIEIFDSNGQQVKVDPLMISACPPDINILPGYGGDPRTVDKLVDGSYFTNDDMHVWLTPFTAGDDHTITIDLPKKLQISMIRIWNYNKSRIHSYRGARLLTCELDGELIFRGEIQKAPGNLNDPENCCEILLFTESNSIMEKIDKNDWINDKIVQGGGGAEFENTQKIMSEVVPSFLEERPMTATKKFGTSEIEEIQRQLRQQKPTSLFDERPQTSAIISGDQWSSESNIPPPMSQKSQSELSQLVRDKTSFKESPCLKGRVLELNITETWGDLFYVGLTGLEVLDGNNRPIPISLNMVKADPRDMNQIAGHNSDYRTLDKLFNGVNNTVDDHNMWLIPFNKGEKHSISIDFGKQQAVSAVRFYNYNKSEEDTLRGVKQVVMWLDKKFVTPRKGISIRKACGFVHPMFNMGQDVKIPVKSGWTTDQIVPLQRQPTQLQLFQEYELCSLPIGFVFKLNLYSTHGDFYYIGLNGVELFDQNGYLLKPSTVIAEPQGVHQLKGMQSDIRVVSNLVNGKNQTFDENNMWLAPFKNTRSYQAVTSAAAQQKAQALESADYRIPNYVCIIFDEPKAISAVKIWNYSKTPSRGVNEFEIIIDDKQLYRGFAKPAPSKDDKSQSQKDFSTVVLFTSEDKIVDKFEQNVSYDPSKQQSVMLINEKKVMNMNSMKARRPEEEYAGVYNEMERPTTMAHKKLY